MKILILGANGFIGSHLCEAILAKTDWQIDAVDLMLDQLKPHPRLHGFIGNIHDKTLMNERISNNHVILPLAAIATPAQYVQNPLRVFELDFEANLSIVRQTAQLKKRLLFPSTSEVYGMCADQEFDEENSHFVTGPLHKERWIYSTSKQLLDRVIYAYGKHQGLQYTLFRPFNWYGPRLDNIANKPPGSARVITQFMGNMLRGEDILLVNGGEQKRSFTYIDDGIAALLKMIENVNHTADQTVFNIGNPNEHVSIRALAELMMRLMKEYQGYELIEQKIKLRSVEEAAYYGSGYQDVDYRAPKIVRAKKYLAWEPKVDLQMGIKKTLDYYFATEKVI